MFFIKIANKCSEQFIVTLHIIRYWLTFSVNFVIYSLFHPIRIPAHSPSPKGNGFPLAFIKYHL